MIYIIFKVKSTQKFTPNLRVVKSSSAVDSNPRSDFPFKIKPDVSVYCADSDPNVKTDSSLAEVFIKFKWSHGDDPFCDPYDISCPHCEKLNIAKSFLHETKTANNTLGQITSYAAAQLSSQYRMHVYSVLIVKNMARILRWDRSGTIMTEAIHYNESPLLVEFFRRYSAASPGMRGKDESVSLPTPVEAVEARQALGLGDDVPLVKLQVPGAHSPLYFITSAPRATPYTPPGRATRGSPAYDILHKTKVFLKDSWRVDLPDIQAKGLTYKTLEDAKVRNIPHCLTSGNISTTDYHAMKTQIFTPIPCACRLHTHFIPHRHYRLVLNIVGRNLTAFESSYEMVSLVSFCDAVAEEEN